MIKRSRSFVSAVLLTVFIVLLLAPARARACDDAPPATLLALYLRSDLILVAEVRSEKDGSITDEGEDYYFVDVERRLSVSSVLKGKLPPNFVFVQNEYRNKTGSAAEESAPDEEIVYHPYGYRGGTEIEPGERYLFFFEKNAETRRFDLTDYVSGVKKLDDYELSVHVKRLRELRAIEKMRKDQAAALTAWLIRCAEEPSTRWDGVFELNESFRRLDYAVENNEKIDNRLVLDRNYEGGAPIVAVNLSDGQKQYLSSLLFGKLQAGQFERDDEFYFGLSALARRWDKARLAMYAFDQLQTIDRAEAEKVKTGMNYLAAVIEDEELSAIAERFPASDETKENEEDEAASTEISSEVKPAAETETKTVETKVADTQTLEVNAPATIERLAETKNAPKMIAAAESEKAKPTLAEIREKLWREFNDRYQYLVATNFEGKKAEQVAER